MELFGRQKWQLSDATKCDRTSYDAVAEQEISMIPAGVLGYAKITSGKEIVAFRTLNGVCFLAP